MQCHHTRCPCRAVLVDEVFLDGNPPEWRFQLEGRDTFDAWIKSFMPHGADTTVVRTIPTVTGFVTGFVGRHVEDGEEITDHMILLAEVRAGRIAELTVYCSGDWTAELRAPSRRRDPTHPPLNRDHALGIEEARWDRLARQIVGFSTRRHRRTKPGRRAGVSLTCDSLARP